MQSTSASSVSTVNHSWVRTVLVGRRPRNTAVRMIVLAAVTVAVFKLVLIPIRVDGTSMEPTYREGGVNFVNRLAYLRHGPERGDIVAIRYSGHSIMLLKRVVALPGETVEFIDGKLWVNGRVLDEPYVKYGCDWNVRPESSELQVGEYYVVGDNRSMEFEDHLQGGARRSRIMGKILL